MENSLDHDWVHFLWRTMLGCFDKHSISTTQHEQIKINRWSLIIILFICWSLVIIIEWDKGNKQKKLINLHEYYIFLFLDIFTINTKTNLIAVVNSLSESLLRNCNVFGANFLTLVLVKMYIMFLVIIHFTKWRHIKPVLSLIICF